MITQYRFALSEDSGRPLPSFWAYRLYAWLLSQIDDDYAEQLHQSGENPLSQSVCRDRASGQDLWEVNLLQDEAAARFAPVLESVGEIPLHGVTLHAAPLSVTTRTLSQLTGEARAGTPARRTTLRFATATAFKSGGRYAIFPQERWLLQTLITRWGLAFPEMPLDDPDAFLLLESGLHIADYGLHTTRYPLKNVKIPGCLGTITVESRLAAPMEEVWQLLLRFAPYAGAGIKTTLGMGALRVEPPRRGLPADDA